MSHQKKETKLSLAISIVHSSHRFLINFIFHKKSFQIFFFLPEISNGIFSLNFILIEISLVNQFEKRKKATKFILFFLLHVVLPFI
jgi:hypothetical protein